MFFTASVLVYSGLLWLVYLSCPHPWSAPRAAEGALTERRGWRAGRPYAHKRPRGRLNTSFGRRAPEVCLSRTAYSNRSIDALALNKIHLRPLLKWFCTDAEMLLGLLALAEAFLEHTVFVNWSCQRKVRSRTHITSGTAPCAKREPRVSHCPIWMSKKLFTMQNMRHEGHRLLRTRFAEACTVDSELPAPDLRTPGHPREHGIRLRRPYRALSAGWPTVRQSNTVVASVLPPFL